MRWQTELRDTSNKSWSLYENIKVMKDSSGSLANFSQELLGHSQQAEDEVKKTTEMSPSLRGWQTRQICLALMRQLKRRQEKRGRALRLMRIPR